MLAAANAVDLTQSEISFSLANYAYCRYKNYQTLDYEGHAKGFEWHYTIYGKSHDVEGFIGYLPSDKSIYVSFMGSESISNWLTNLDTVKSKYDEWPECSKCEVHAGFEAASNETRQNVIDQVNLLKKQYPTAKVKTTGHSLGAALATLTSMSLVKAGIHVD